MSMVHAVHCTMVPSLVNAQGLMVSFLPRSIHARAELACPPDLCRGGTRGGARRGRHATAAGRSRGNRGVRAGHSARLSGFRSARCRGSVASCAGHHGESPQPWPCVDLPRPRFGIHSLVPPLGGFVHRRWARSASIGDHSLPQRASLSRGGPLTAHLGTCRPCSRWSPLSQPASTLSVLRTHLLPWWLDEMRVAWRCCRLGLAWRPCRMT